MSRQRRSRSKSVSTANPEHQWIATEIAIKLATNSILSALAIVSLFKLIPYQWSQQAQLKEIRVEVEETEKRVSQLRDDFRHNFDPHKTEKVMEEQSPRLYPTQRRIFWLN
ncbi:slr1601 family putative cell division protein [Crocosphaera sp. Alani8]|uniref:slr1601 family putative cell division protein n=1 Tax=Crocosphaera sp. Alani8 TaxID=3038952 RepID=UPI00313F11C8